MFKRNKRSSTTTIRAVVGLLVASALPMTAMSGLTADQAIDAPRDSHVAEAAGVKTGGTYRIRCWQYGRLLFEENGVTLPLDASQYAQKLRGLDRQGAPLVVADTKNATCLVQVPPVRESLSFP